MKTRTQNPTPDLQKIQMSCDICGVDSTSVVAMEECGELIQCVAKELRGKSDKTHMEEEIGDVLISVSNLIYIYDLDEEKIQRWIDFKQNRQMNRIRRLE